MAIELRPTAMEIRLSVDDHDREPNHCCNGYKKLLVRDISSLFMLASGHFRSLYSQVCYIVASYLVLIHIKT